MDLRRDEVRVSRTEPNGGLGDDVRREADGVLLRFHETWSRLWECLPEGSRSASAASSYLGVERTTCQRVAYVVARPYGGFETLGRLPGERAMRELIEAARGVLGRREQRVVEDAEAAMEGVIGLWRRRNVSRVKVMEALEEPSGRAVIQGGLTRSGSDEAVRRQLYECGCAVTGRRSEVLFSIGALLPDPDGGGWARLHRLVGCRSMTARADALPFVISDFRVQRREGDGAISGRARGDGLVGLDGEVEIAGGAGAGLGGERSAWAVRDVEAGEWLKADVVGRFSSSPAPVVESRSRGQLLVRHASSEISPGEPLHLARLVQQRVRHPGLEPSGVEASWILHDFPTERLVMELLVHHELAVGVEFFGEAHLWDVTGVSSSRDDAWRTRLSSGPTVSPIDVGELRGSAALADGEGARDASLESVGWERLSREMRGWLLKSTGQEAEAFAGQRYEIAHPIWRAGYCLGVEGIAPPR